MVDLVTIRDGPSLIPATPFDLELLEKVRGKRPLRTSVVFSRSVPHNRWYRALVSVVADGLGLHPDTLHAELKFKAGLVRRILMAQCGPVVELESCAFATMDEAKFTEYVNLAVEIIFRDYLPGVKRKGVYARVEELVGPRPE
jgi:hypothetical protein